MNEYVELRGGQRAESCYVSTFIKPWLTTIHLLLYNLNYNIPPPATLAKRSVV